MSGWIRAMPTIDNNLTRVLRGENTGKVPFWEVWFCNYGFAHECLGGIPKTPEDFLPFVRRMGWEYLTEGGGGRGAPTSGAEASDGTSHYIQGGFHSLAQLEDVPPLDLDEIGSRVEKRLQFAHAHDLALIVYMPWCFHSIATAMGLEALSYKLADDIDFVHTAMEFIEEANREIAREVLVPLDVDVVLYDGDCAFKNGLMVSPPVFRELVFDRTARSVAPLKAAGIPYVLHSDGKADDLLPILIELGFSGFHGVEAVANDLGNIKARFGKDITLIGNMDVVFLTHASPDEVRKATREMLDTGAPGGRYIAACNTSPMDYIPIENYAAFVDTILEYEPLS